MVTHILVAVVTGIQKRAVLNVTTLFPLVLLVNVG